MYITAINFALLALKWAVHGLHTAALSDKLHLGVPAVTYLTGSCRLGRGHARVDPAPSVGLWHHLGWKGTDRLFMDSPSHTQQNRLEGDKYRDVRVQGDVPRSTPAPRQALPSFRLEGDK